MIHSLVIGLTLVITSGSEFSMCSPLSHPFLNKFGAHLAASLVTAIIFHQLFEGLSLGIRISSLPKSGTNGKPKSRQGGGSEFSLLQVTLMILFAITTPVGIVIGLVAFSESSVAHNKLTQGLLCALSAGMLIYVSCVEMLAGDFVMDSGLWRSAVWRQCLALGSLMVGVVGMSIIGIWR